MGSNKKVNTFKIKLLTLAVIASLGNQSVLAAPTGASVLSGTASIATSGSTMTITNTPNAIINWANFGIAASETVKFVQQSSASAVLNRVTGNNPSQILGALQSNGKVFLINPNGIMFGAGARIDVNGLVASTLNMTDADFLSGRMRFDADRAIPGSVVNAGQINTPTGGFVYLLAPNVENSGVITTPSGEAILAAGNAVEIVNSTDPSQRVLVSATSQDINLSQLMTQSNGNIFSVLNSGKVSANTVVQDATGKIFFKSAGNIQTTTTSIVEVKGDANLDGGSFIGFAGANGIYTGSFDVSGMNGGFIETSGHWIDVNSAQINARGLGANAGRWLLDPYNIYVEATGTQNFSLSGSTYSGNVDNSIIWNSTINNLLDTGATVTLDTSGAGSQPGNIYINAPINSNSVLTGGSNALTLSADYVTGSGWIYINAPITSTNTTQTFNISLQAGGGIYGTEVIGTGLAGGAVNLYAKGGDINAIVNTAMFSATNYGSGYDTNIKSEYAGTISSIGINNPYWSYVTIKNQANFNTSVINTANGIGGLSINVPNGNITANGLPSMHYLKLSANNVMVSNAITVADGGGWEGAGVGIWANQSATINAAITANSTATPVNYLSGAWIEIGSGSSTTINANISATSTAANTEADIDIWSAGSLTQSSGSTITASAPLFTEIFLEGWNSATISGSITASSSADDSIDMLSQNLTLSGASVTADWISLNYVNDFIDVTAQEFFDFNSTSTVMINNSTINGALGIGFAGNNVTFTSSDLISNSLMHGIAMNDMKLDASSLDAVDEMLLEVGGHLYLDNSSSIYVVSPLTLFFNFPLLASDGWFVDGVANAFSGTTGSYISVNGAEPILGSNFFVTYGGLSLVSAVLGNNFSALSDSISDANPIATETSTAEDFFGADANEEDPKEEEKSQQCSA